MLKDFIGFLKEYRIVALAVAFVMGTASTNVVNSLVKNIVMPFLAPLLGSTSAWQDATLSLGPIKVAYGAFLADFINFLILALVVFIVTKKLFKEEQKAEAAKV